MSVQSSQTIGAIAAALAKAQGEVMGAAKDRVNPHFKAPYATLASVWEACRGALSKHGIAVVQSPSADGAVVSVETRLIHSSGEWIACSLSAAGRDATPQSVGSATTYLRRYGLMSMVGIAPEDDDGNDSQPAVHHEHPTVTKAKQTFPDAQEVKDEWHVGRFKAVCGRLWPGVTESDLQELTDGALELMGANRKMLPAKGGVWALFQTGGMGARQEAIMKAEELLKKNEPMPDFKGDK